MQTVILAAGTGKRLEDATKVKPKCLVNVGDETILSRHIRLLSFSGIEKKDITLVIGKDGPCWNENAVKEVEKIGVKILMNEKNLSTNNTFSLRIALENMKKDNVFVIDGDLVLSEYVIRKMMKGEVNTVLTKESYMKNDTRNKIVTEEDGSINEVGKHIPNETIQLPFLVYGAIIRVTKNDFGMFRGLVFSKKHEKNALSVVVNDLSKKIKLYPVIDQRWINVNTEVELEDARRLASYDGRKPMIVFMSGYTGVGKSTLALKISKMFNTRLFHSAVIRKNLGLAPKKEDLNKFFDYRKGLRKDVDKKVYREMAMLAEKETTKGYDVILDAGHFFSWQRNAIYKKASLTGAEVVAIRVIYDDEKEIKRRLEKRANEFEKSPLNETPSWNTYIATKELTEPIENDTLPNGGKPALIEYDAIKKEAELVQGNIKSKNVKFIMESLRTQ